LATITVQQITRVGAAPTFAAVAGGGDAVPVAANIYVELKNTSGAPITVTFATIAAGAPFPGTALAAETVSVPATTGDILYGPLLPQLFSDPTTGMCTVTYSASAGLTIGAFQLAPL
jgi:hypothetical protein